MNTLRMEAFPECMLCGVRGGRLYAGMPDRLFGVPGEFGFRRCADCGLLWLDPRPVAEDIPKCYEDYYTHENIPEASTGGEHRPLSKLRDALRRAILCGYYGYRHIYGEHDRLCRLGPLLAKVPFLRYRAVYDDLRERFPRYTDKKVNLLIDIGCGRGDYPARMKSLGWNVLGIEPDPLSAELAKAKGVPVIVGNLGDAEIADETADQVTLQHVIEHLADPRAGIRECHRIVRKGGRVIIYTPNHESLGHRVFRDAWLPLDPPRHLFIFSERSMRRLIESSPFREYRISTVPASASNIYDGSLLISREGRIPPGTIPRQEGRHVFAWKEKGMCLLGRPRGEEIETILVKT